MDLNTILIILGILALIGLVTHGIWANRREKSQYFHNANQFNRGASNETAQSFTPPNFTQPAQNSQKIAESNQNPAAQTPFQPLETQPFENQAVNESAQHNLFVEPQSVPEQNMFAEQHVSAQQNFNALEQIKISLPNEDSQSQAQVPVYYEYKPEPKASVQPVQNMAERTLDDLAQYENTEEGINTSSAQLRVQLQEAAVQHSPISSPKLQQPVEPEPSLDYQQAANEREAVEFVLLYVVSPENRPFSGASLAQSLDNFGFVFGKDKIYHRHVDSVATPILFSLANINQPGTFNPQAMHDFSTLGVALFMSLPSRIGNDKANLRMLIQTAKNLAQELGGFVLTEQQQLFDDSAEQAYLAKVQ